MRIVTWNVHRAIASSPVWGLLLDLSPDIALLQEVGNFPNAIANAFHTSLRRAVSKTGRAQKFMTAVFAKGDIEDIALSSAYEWVDRELAFFHGNFVACSVQPGNSEPPLIAVSVHSPAWQVDPDRLRGVDVSAVKTKLNPKVWGTDILWAALHKSISTGHTWVVGGDYNASETFDVDWQARNLKKFGVRSSGNGETLERMCGLGLTECLRASNSGAIIPTFRTSRGGGVDHQIDHLFVSNGLYSRLERCCVGDPVQIFGGSRRLSDHLPIIAEFRSDCEAL